MIEHIIEITDEGYFVQDVLISDRTQAPKHFTTVKLPTDKNNIQKPFYKPKWDGKKWIETATKEEIEEINKPPTQEGNSLEEYKKAFDILLGGSK